MSAQKLSKSKIRDAAFKREALRMQRKIYAQEAKIARLESELKLRPPYEPTKPGAGRAEIEKWARSVGIAMHKV